MVSKFHLVAFKVGGLNKLATLRKLNPRKVYSCPNDSDLSLIQFPDRSACIPNFQTKEQLQS